MYEALLNRMVILFAFIAIGFLLGKIKKLPADSDKTLSKLENYLFVPALVLGTFIEKCTPETFAAAWSVMLVAVAVLAVFVVFGIVSAKIVYKDDYMRRIVTYGLAFSNFGFMGLAVMRGVFPEMFFEYSVFIIPFYAALYAWGIPVLLISDGADGKKTAWDRVKPFVNPMFIAMIVGMIIGLTGLGAFIPAPVTEVIGTLGDCMSPMAMILTGLVVSETDLKKIFFNPKTYIVTAIKLLFFPLVYVFATAFIPRGDILTPTAFICGLAVATMPFGMNSIVIPVAYGKDVTDASGMTLISHVLSIITIPLMFLLYTSLV